MSVDDFTEADLLQAFAGLLPSTEGLSVGELVTLLRASGEAGDWTDDTLILLSLTSAALEQRVMEILAPTFTGAAGQSRRRAWEQRRALLKRELEVSQAPPSD